MITTNTRQQEEKAMPPRKLNNFEKARNAYNRLTNNQPVGQAAIFGALEKMETEGNTLLRTKEIGTLAFAKTMQTANQKALTLHEDSQIEPPLTDDNVTRLNTKNETLQIFIDAESETPAAEPSPVNPETIPTAGRKG